MKALGGSTPALERLTDGELASLSYQKLRESIASNDDLMDDETATTVVVKEISEMREERRNRSRFPVHK